MMKKLILIVVFFLVGCQPMTPEQQHRFQQWTRQQQNYIQGLNQQEQQRMQESQQRHYQQRMLNSLQGIERNLRK
ncbi:hypothetical protein LCGC14_2013730 [marine sediment metagenome]|uniref:Lipoprotein n=1 Tax=marine sediment metagenome TaxID=412755 RepID=A0A0F9FM08_9ZZZZ